MTYIYDNNQKDTIKELLTFAIQYRNNDKLDLIITLIEHFDVIVEFDLIVSSLLIEPRLNCHDTIARIL